MARGALWRNFGGAALGRGISEVEEVDELQAAAGQRATELCVVCISPAVGAK